MKYLLLILFTLSSFADTAKLEKQFESVEEWDQKSFYQMGRSLMEEAPASLVCLHHRCQGEKERDTDG